MPYNRRWQGLCAIERNELEKMTNLALSLMAMFANIPEILQPAVFATIAALMARATTMSFTTWEPTPAINDTNFDRNINSWDEDKCWNWFRFRKADLVKLYTLLLIPQLLPLENERNGFVTGEFALVVLLYRLHYPGTLQDNLVEFGCDYSKMCKIFNSTLNFLYDTHKNKILCNIEWYSDRFDMYHEVCNCSMILNGIVPTHLPLLVSPHFFVPGNHKQIIQHACIFWTTNVAYSTGKHICLH